MFLFKVALSNLIHNRKITFPYIVSGGLFTFFSIIIFNFIEGRKFYYADSFNDTSLQDITFSFILIISFLFMLFANHYLNNSQNRQFSLYATFGMSKHQIRLTMIYENIIFYVLTQIIGNLLNLGFFKLIFLIFKKVVGSANHHNGQFSFHSVKVVAIMFLMMFIIVTSLTLIKISFLNINQLMHNHQKHSNHNNWTIIFGIIGIIFLLAGYYLSIRPIHSYVQFLYYSLTSVILVAIGLLGTVTFGIMIIIKLIQSNHKWFYKMPHFINVATINHRLKSSSLSMAMVTLLLTMILISTSCVSSLYLGEKTFLNNTFSPDLIIDNDGGELNNHEIDQVDHSINHLAKKEHVKIKNESHVQTILNFEGHFQNQHFNFEHNYYITDGLSTMDINWFNKHYHTNYQLNPHQILLFSNHHFKNHSIKFFDQHYHIKKTLANNPVSNDSPYTKHEITSNTTAVMNLNDIKPLLKQLGFQSNALDNHNKLYYKPVSNQISYHLKGANQSQINHFEDQIQAFRFYHYHGKSRFAYNIQTKHQEASLTKARLGELFFTGCLIDLIFVILIIIITYYKQIAESQADQNLYHSLHCFGMNKSEINQLIKKQINFTTLIPIAFSIVSTFIAWHLIDIIFSMWGLSQLIFKIMMINSIILIIIYIIVTNIISYIVNHN